MENMNNEQVGVEGKMPENSFNVINEIKSLLKLALKNRKIDSDVIINRLTNLSYFKVPSSIKFHENTAKTEGLAIHSYLVCKKALAMMNNYGMNIKNEKQRDSVILITLLHDLGKVLEYKWDEKKHSWYCLPNHLVGDENSSVFLILKTLQIDLSFEEINAIKLHNIFSESTRAELNRQLSYNKQRKKESLQDYKVNLILLLQHSDQIVSLYLNS